MKIKTASSSRRRELRKIRSREKLKGTKQRPRLCVFRSNRGIYAQIIDDQLGRTLVSASVVSKSAGQKSKKDQAFVLGEELAQKALKSGIKRVVFDRNGYLYHGRVKELARGAREKGLEF